MTSSLEQWRAVLLNTYGEPPIELVEGSGAWVTDVDGKHYLDMLAGIAVNALGHGHPDVVQAVTDQIARLGHTSNLFATKPAVQLASKLIARWGAPDARVFFCNSGAEANEAAFKLARLTGRRRILSAFRGFHGRTMGALALTGQPDKQRAFQPLPAGVEFFEYGDREDLTRLVMQDPSDTAAIILEPIQGETGVVPAPPGFLRTVRELCDEHGILMVVDEVQTGVGRTGTFFAHEADGVSPDIITMAKGLGGGLPIGACMALGSAAELFTPGSHGTTFGGNPVCCAAANAVVDLIDEQFLAAVIERGEQLKAAMEAIDGVDHVRGRGLMLGVVLAQPVAKTTARRALEHGLIVNATSESVVRLTPPLVLNASDVTTCADRFAAALKGAE